MPPARPQPQFKVVKDHILRQMTEGHLAPGDRIPSEKELCQAFDLSRMTVNRALSELAADGILIRLQGVGTFVSTSRAEAAQIDLGDIADDINDSGRRYTCQTLLQAGSHSPEINSHLGLAPNAEHYHATLLHLADDVPIQMELRWVNPALASDFLSVDFSNVTMHEYLMSLGPLQAAQHVFEATVADADTAKTLKIPVGAPLMELRRRTWTRNFVATYARFQAVPNLRRFEGKSGELPNLADRLPRL